MSHQQADDRQPLLQHNNGAGHKHTVDFDDEHFQNPRLWPKRVKYGAVLQISVIAFVLPMASSIYAPAASAIATEFGASSTMVLLNQTGFVCMLGIGPLFFAPMSEAFGRRTVYLINLVAFTLVQIPVALAPNVETFIVFRALSGLFGSVGVGNGGGSITDMFDVHERTTALGFYMVFPLLAPSLGPLIGAVLVDRTSWRWITWLNMILAAVISVVSYFFLYESRAVVILQGRQKKLEKEHPGTAFQVEGASDDSIMSKVAGNSTRAIKILVTQPVVLTMSIYQALVFSTMYSLYAQYSSIWSNIYSFNKTQVGLAYLAPAGGFIVAAFFIVIYMDQLYNYMTRLNDEDEGRPEYRLPMASIGSILLPVSLFWFGWTVHERVFWLIPLAAMTFFGASQVSIFNTVQTYYIDAYEKNAASALAAGAFLRSIVGGIVPLFVGGLAEQIGIGPVMSIFGAIAVVLMPAPLVFYWKGRQLRERFPFES